MPIPQRPEQFWVFGRIVFEIGILHDAEIAAGFLYGGAHRSPFALVGFLSNKPNAGMLSRQAVQNFYGAVRGTIVYDDELTIDVLRERGCQYLSQALFYHGAFVIDGYQDREPQ